MDKRKRVIGHAFSDKRMLQSSCLNGIESIRKNADSEIVEED